MRTCATGLAGSVLMKAPTSGSARPFTTRGRRRAGSPKAARTFSPIARLPRRTRASTSGQQLQDALEQCIAFSRKGGVASANERGDHKAYYHCGAIFGLVAERASRGDFGSFVRRPDRGQSRRQGGHRAEWLAALDARAPGKGLGAAVGKLLDQPAADAKPWIALLEGGGIPVTVGADGVPRLQ